MAIGTEFIRVVDILIYIQALMKKKIGLLFAESI